MLFLVLQRIQDRSEQTLDVLKILAAQLDISELKGEDVEQAVRLIKSTCRVLKSSSADSRSCAPRDFVKTVMFALQTATVREFNEVFYDLERKPQVDADMEGVQPKWPSKLSKGLMPILFVLLVFFANESLNLIILRTGRCVVKKPKENNGMQ